MYQECPICKGSGLARMNMDDLVSGHERVCDVCHGHKIIHMGSGCPPSGDSAIVKARKSTVLKAIKGSEEKEPKK